MSDYERIARVIRSLDQGHTGQPDLATLAKGAGLSRFHLHRLFSKWAGITPKDFLQCLTLAHARQLLRMGESVLDAAVDCGLSGPGRLHDLCVSLEAATPGEWKSGGAGWTITAGLAETPFGMCLIAQSPRGICHLSFLEPAASEAAKAALQQDWPQAEFDWDDRAAACLAAMVFQAPDPATHRPGLRAFVRGTPFQIRVWRALLQVPPGTLVTYGRLAAHLGNPGAARAVGAAAGRNSLAYLIPCHRVIRETGVVSDYRWGSSRKKAMLAWDCARVFRASE